MMAAEKAIVFAAKELRLSNFMALTSYGILLLAELILHQEKGLLCYRT